MEDNVAPGGGTVDALMAGMDLLEEMRPAGPVARERGLSSESDLLAGLADDDADVRRGCLELLDDASSDTAAPHVLECLDDPEWAVRYTAVHAISSGTTARAGELGSSLVSAVIRTATTDTSRFVRMLATEVVANAAGSDPVAARAVVTVRDTDADPTVRRKAGRYAPGGALHRDTGT